MRLIVIGGGAAGFFCAATAARLNPSLEVIILEKSSRVLSKVRISGGGRCNVTHACFSITEMMRRYPRGQNFVKKSFHQFFTTDTIQWFEERGVKLKDEEDGRMFPVTDSSETIINCLENEVRKCAVKLRLRTEVKSLSPLGERWQLTLADGNVEITDYVCIACGGFPKRSMFYWIMATGHRIEDPVPSLFTFNIPSNGIKQLMGISLNAQVKIPAAKMQDEGPVLITHWGLSGPAVLRLSARAARELSDLNYRFRIIVNWCPDFNEHTLRERFVAERDAHGAARVGGRNHLGMPQRLWEHLCAVSAVGESTRWAELTAAAQNMLVKNTCAMELQVEGKTTYKEEFVTAGGVVLSEIDPNTMQSKLHKGLYFAGEIMDVDGITGGYNFQHAWTSGFVAGKSIALSSSGT